MVEAAYYHHFHGQANLPVNLPWRHCAHDSSSYRHPHMTSNIPICLSRRRTGGCRVPFSVGRSICLCFYGPMEQSQDQPQPPLREPPTANSHPPCNLTSVMYINSTVGPLQLEQTLLSNGVEVEGITTQAKLSGSNHSCGVRLLFALMEQEHHIDPEIDATHTRVRHTMPCDDTTARPSRTGFFVATCATRNNKRAGVSRLKSAPSTSSFLVPVCI